VGVGHKTSDFASRIGRGMKIAEDTAFYFSIRVEMFLCQSISF
jgi:hypothetical protein